MIKGKEVVGMYKAKNVDTDKALEALEKARDIQDRKRAVEIREVQKYYEGVCKGLDIAEEIFHCSTYEKDGDDNEV